MRKEELDRRSDELKARMLAERNQAAQKKPSSEGKRESASRAKPSDRVAKVPGEISSTERLEMDALKKRIAQLVAENESCIGNLRQSTTRHHRHPDLVTIPFASSSTIF